MPHIALIPNLPGMIALGTYRPDVYTRLASLADLLLQHQHPLSTLTPGDRELIGAYVSSLNTCAYCTLSHSTIATVHLGSPTLVDAVQAGDFESSSDMSPKMKALLRIAGLAQRNGKEVTGEAVEEAKKVGATDMDIHDTVLITGLFSMLNRYVDGLKTEMPGDKDMFVERSKGLAEHGYMAAGKGLGGGDRADQGS